MSGDGHYEFNANRIFMWLFIFTAAEVAWGYAGNWLEWGRVLLWGGLIGFALFKGIYIAMYFMHLRFEGWIVKGMILPTPFLIAVILLAISPDVSRNEQLVHEIGSMYDPKTGEVHEFMENTSGRQQGEHEDGEPAEADGGPAH